MTGSPTSNRDEKFVCTMKLDKAFYFRHGVIKRCLQHNIGLILPLIHRCHVWNRFWRHFWCQKLINLNDEREISVYNIYNYSHLVDAAPEKPRRLNILSKYTIFSAGNYKVLAGVEIWILQQMQQRSIDCVIFTGMRYGDLEFARTSHVIARIYYVAKIKTRNNWAFICAGLKFEFSSILTCRRIVHLIAWVLVWIVPHKNKLISWLYFPGDEKPAQLHSFSARGILNYLGSNWMQSFAHNSKSVAHIRHLSLHF